jgi:hypothetical protein
MKKGLLAEFEKPETLVHALKQLRTDGYRALEAFTPFPVPEAEEALELPRSRLPRFVLAAGLLGGATGYFVQWFCNAFDYPINVGGRPLHSAPAFIPITFEMTILAASLTAVIGVFVAARLPKLWRPIFEAEGFDRAFVDRFFVGVDAGDARFDRERSERELRELGALSVVPFGEAQP